MAPSSVRVAPLPLYWYRAPQSISAKAGMHRFMWDPHYQPLAPVPGVAAGGGRGAAFAPGGAAGGQGRSGAPTIGNLPISAVPYDTVPARSTPWVAPGEYTVKLTVGGTTYAQRSP